MMTAQQRSLVRESWLRVTPIAETAAGLFYERLFALDPSLRALFARSDMQAQGRKLMQMLDVAVAQLDRPEALMPAVVALGRRHAGYGVRDAHYAVVGEALLWTLAQGLGDAFTDEVRDAWATTYATLTEAMREEPENLPLAGARC